MNDQEPQFAEAVMIDPADSLAVTEAVVDRSERNSGVASLAIAILVHAGLLALLAFIVVKVIEEAPPDLVVASGPQTVERNMDKKIFETKNQPKPSAPSMASQLINSSAMSNVSVPSLDIADPNPTIGIGDSFGLGFGTGSGGNGGGSGVAFFGSKSVAQRVAFIIDVSKSLSDRQFEMIKDELNKSLSKLAASVQYQVLFFSGPAWFAEDSYKVKQSAVVSGGKKYGWTRKGKTAHFDPDDGEKISYPKRNWMPANKKNLKKTATDIKQVERSFGTDWRWPLKLALELDPKPDVIYFLTDGAVKDGDKMVELTLKRERRVKGAKTKINTISMMQPKAVDNLLELAKKTRGQFTIVHENGSTEIIKR